MWDSILTRAGLVVASAVFLGIAVSGVGACPAASAEQEWKIHDVNRPQPPIVNPGTASTQDQLGQPPSDAIVLFDGKDLSSWRRADSEPAKWKVESGYLLIVPGSGNIWTKQPFGDCQLHIEWASPDPPRGPEYDRGNSGVFLMGLYEVQIFDSYKGGIYADGQAAAIYGQYPPLVNASRPPGEWQTYDTIFHGPQFDKDGTVLRPARLTVLHNGVLVQDNVELTGPTEHKQRPPYRAHPDKLPLMLQEHGNPVRFRNIWMRELSASPQ